MIRALHCPPWQSIVLVFSENPLHALWSAKLLLPSASRFVDMLSLSGAHQVKPEVSVFTIRKTNNTALAIARIRDGQ